MAVGSVNVTVTDQSSTWVYTPQREAAFAAGWESDFSPEPSYDPTHTQTNLASGVSSHTTSLSGATAQLQFVGSAISIYGTGTAGAYTTTLDNGSAVPGKPSGSLLASYNNLDGSVAHTILLTATQATNLTLSYAEFTIRSNVKLGQVSNSTQVAVTESTSGTTNSFTTSSFFSSSGANITNVHVDDGYTRLDTDGAGATISFTCSNASAVFVYGTSNYNHGPYTITLDPPAGASTGTLTFNATSKWFVLDNLAYFETGLDPKQTYTVTMTNLNSGSYADVHSAVMMSLPADDSAAPGSSSASASTSSATASTSPSAKTSSSSSTAKTAGIAVAVVAIAAALLLFGFICLRRRSRKQREKEHLSLGGMLVTPFEDHPDDLTPAHTLSSASMMRPMSANGSQLGAAGGAGYNTYSTYSSSTHDLRAPPARLAYSEFSNSPRTSMDFDPYAGIMRPPQQPFAHGHSPSASGSGASLLAGGSGSGSATGSVAGSAGPLPSKRRLPTDSDTASVRQVRQETDAGRVPEPQHQEEEILPPTYDPNWSRAE
uniref:Uncharacterized protein n=1 Tax=Mycena chlorophos TaxID=658473 RepID=A0ABQ0M579_MYCCL|nr:predicted protein [Mycena chlorophos]